MNASTLSTFVTEQLRETLTVMMANVVVATSLTLSGRPRSADDILIHPQATTELRAALHTLNLAAAGRTAVKLAEGAT